MDCNKTLLFFLCSLLTGARIVLYGAEPPFQDSGTPKHYFIAEGKKGAVLYQHLSWQNAEYILGFEFELERKSADGDWEQIKKESVKENFIDVSLTPGIYRYRVAVVNLLGQSESFSDYREFTVIQAFQPKVESLSPRVIYLDNIPGNRLIVRGENLFEQTVFSLEKKSAAPVILTPAEPDKDGTQAVFELNISRLPPGTYVFYARDKSGLYDNSHTFKIGFQKPMDIYTSLGYAMSVFAGRSVLKDYYGKDFAPLGGVFRCTVFPLKRYYGRFGLNFGISMTSVERTFTDYKITGLLTYPQFNFAYSYTFIKGRLNLDVHAGIGMLFLNGAQFVFQDSDIKSPVYNYGGLSANAGTALQVYIYKKLYLEFNIDNGFVFRQGMPRYVFQPQLSIGWEF